MLQGVYEVLGPEGYDVSPSFIVDKKESERYFAQLPKNRNADAIVISSFQLDETARAELRSTDMPTVGVDIPAASFCDAAIGIDNFDGMFKAVRLLRSLGHTRIAFLGDYIPDDMVYSTSQRTEAFLEAAEENGYDDGDAAVICADEHGVTLSKSDLAAQLVAKVVGYTGELHFDASKPDGTPKNLMDSSRLEQLGWKAGIDLETGLKTAYADYLAGRA